MTSRSSLFNVVLIFSATLAAGVALKSSVIDILLSAFCILIGIDFFLAAVRQFRRSQPGDARSTMRRSGFGWRHGVLIAAIVGKWFWFAGFPISEKALEHGGSREDLLLRRDYLLERIVRQPFGPADSPIFFNEVLQEEWAIVTLSMLGAALANLSFEFPETREEHLRFIDAIIRRILEPDIRSFEQHWWSEDALDSLEGPNGHIGYLGHLNFLLVTHRLLGGGTEFAELSAKISSALARRMMLSPSRYLETFPNQIWVPDNTVVVASLALSNLIEQRSGWPAPYHAAVDSWLEITRKKLIDSQTGLLVSRIDTQGHPIEHPRGSYATWNVFYLLQIDRPFAEDQSRRIRESFVVETLPGLCAVREYLTNYRGVGDIDSGPVIFGLSTSGTGFGMAAARALKDTHLLGCLLRTGELVGSSLGTTSGRRYLTAPLIGDVIVLAMRTASAWDGRYIVP